MSPGNGFAIYLAGGGGFTSVDLEQEIQSLTNPVAPSGQAIVGTVEDLQAQTRVKAYRARQAVSTTFDLLAHDLLTATLWLDVRKSQDPSRNFGDGPTAAWTAFRKIVPLLPDMEGVRRNRGHWPRGSQDTPANTFLGAGDDAPLVGKSIGCGPGRGGQPAASWWFGRCSAR
jgi:histidine ammonia-lyase